MAPEWVNGVLMPAPTSEEIHAAILRSLEVLKTLGIESRRQALLRRDSYRIHDAMESMYVLGQKKQMSAETLDLIRYWVPVVVARHPNTSLATLLKMRDESQHQPENASYAEIVMEAIERHGLLALIGEGEE